MQFILNDDFTYKEVDFDTWVKVYDIQKRKRLIQQEHIYGMFVSTVFLMFNHGFNDKKPVLFETMIFDPNDNGDHYQERYSTYEDALAGHERAIAYIKEQYNNTCICGAPAKITNGAITCSRGVHNI